MEKGKIVMVYEDPITKKVPEGEAKLIQPLGSEADAFQAEYWQVEFLANNFIASRWVS